MEAGQLQLEHLGPDTGLAAEVGCHVSWLHIAGLDMIGQELEVI